MSRDRSVRLAQGLVLLLILLAAVQVVRQHSRANIGAAFAPQAEGVVQVTGGELSRGVEIGDRIVAVSGQSIATAAQYAEALRAATGPVELTLSRKGAESVHLQLESAQLAGLETQASGPCVVVTSAAEGTPAHQAGVVAGDVIVAVDGAPIAFGPSPDPLQRALGVPIPTLASRLAAARSGDRLTLRVLRGDGAKELSVSVASLGFWTDGSANLQFLLPPWTTLGLLGLAWALVRLALRLSRRGSPDLWAWYGAFIYCVMVMRRPGAGYVAMHSVLDVGLIVALFALLLAGKPSFRSRYSRSWLRAITERLGQAGRSALGPLWSLVVAAAAFLVLMSIDAATPLQDDKSILSWLRRMTFHEGLCGQAILFVFLLGCVTLFGIRRRMATELDLSDVDPRDELDDLPPGAFRTAAAAVEERMPSDPSYQVVKEGAATALDELHDQWARSFVRVAWAEAAMPILGFLGTVVGFAGALPPLKGLLQQRVAEAGESTIDMGKALGECLDNMSLAFNTTFLGLLGVLLVGMAHVITRASVRGRLARLAAMLDARVEVLPTTSDAVGLVQVQVAVAASRSAMDRLREDVARGRNFVDAMIAEGDSPFWQDARRVAFQGVVGFEEAPRHDLEELIGAELEGEDWSLRDLVAAGPDGRAHALVHAGGGRQWVLRFTVAQGNGELFALPEDEDYRGLVGAEGNLAVLSAPVAGRAAALRIELKDGDAEPRGAPIAAKRVLPWVFGQHRLLLAVLADIGVLSWSRADGKGRHLAKFGSGVLDHALIATTPGAVFVCHEVDGGHVLYRLAPEADKEGWPATLEIAVPTADLGTIAPREIAALSADELLLVGDDDKLWYWSTHKIRPARVPQIAVPAVADLLTGRSPWLAVARNHQLAMWRLMPAMGGGAGGLDSASSRKPADRDRQTGEGGVPLCDALQFKDRAGVAKSYPIGGVEGLVASGDGLHVLGYRGRTIFTWSFPATRLDR